MTSLEETKAALRSAAAGLAAARRRPCLLLVTPHLCRPDVPGTVQAIASLSGGPLDVVLSSNGGCIDGAYLLARELQRASGDLTLFVPLLAKSAATLIALAADELVLGPLGELGPLDVQSKKRRAADSPAEVSGLLPFKGLGQLKNSALGLYVDCIKQVMEGSGMSPFDAGAKATEVIGVLYGPMFAQIDPMAVAESARGLELPFEYGVRLVRRRRPALAPQIEAILHRLIHNYPDHGFVIDLEELGEIGIPARGPTTEEAGSVDALAAALRDHGDRGDLIEMVMPAVPVPEACSEQQAA